MDFFRFPGFDMVSSLGRFGFYCRLAGFSRACGCFFFFLCWFKFRYFFVFLLFGGCLSMFLFSFFFGGLRGSGGGRRS